ncbi:hypothetical protein D3C87_1339290 [compost metagenome]
MQPVHGFGRDQRRRLPDLVLLVALDGFGHRALVHAREERHDLRRQRGGRRVLHVFLGARDHIGPGLDDLGVVAYVFVGGGKDGVVHLADLMAHRGHDVAFAVADQFAGLGLQEDAVFALPRHPRAGTGRDADVVQQLHVFLRVQAMFAQGGFQKHDGVGTGPKADDFLALEHGPVELFDRLARQQEEAVGGGQAREDLRLDRRFAVLHIDGRLGPDQHDVGAAGQERGHALVGALRGFHGHVQPGILEIALRQGHVFRHVQDGSHDLFVAHLHGGIQGFGLSGQGGKQRGDQREQRRARQARQWQGFHGTFSCVLYGTPKPGATWPMGWNRQQQQGSPNTCCPGR